MIFDQAMENWARWCWSGGIETAKKSTLARMADGEIITFDGSGFESLDLIEADIESVLFELSVSKKIIADVVRIEYGFRVIDRPGNPIAFIRAGQLRKAADLGLSIRTYRRYLSYGRKQIRERIAKRLH